MSGSGAYEAGEGSGQILSVSTTGSTTNFFPGLHVVLPRECTSCRICHCTCDNIITDSNINHKKTCRIHIVKSYVGRNHADSFFPPDQTRSFIKNS
jgi:hypothetical protein